MELKPGYKQTEVGVIPEEWQVSRLGDLAEFITSGSRGWARYYSDSGSLFIRSQNVREGMLDFSDKQHVRPPSGAEGERTGARIGDVLITITGNSVGNVAYLNQDFGSAYVSQHVGLARLKDPRLADYICRYLTPCAPGNPQIEISQSGQSKPGLNLQNLKDFRLAIPTSSVERDAISKALSDIDSAIEQLCKLIAKKRAIKQAAMQELLTGKRRLPGFEGEWEVRKLGDYIEKIVGGGTPSRANPGFWGGEIPWATVKDLTSFQPNQTQEWLTRDGLKNSSANLIPAGTLIVSTRMALGKAVIFETDVAINQDLKAIFFGKNGMARFFCYWFEANASAIDSIGGGSTVKGISLSQLKALDVASPDLAEQNAIVDVISDVETEIESLENRLTKTRAIKQAMMQELLTGRIRLR
jgi:type I restriction enzyme S subunit